MAWSYTRILRRCWRAIALRISTLPYRIDTKHTLQWYSGRRRTKRAASVARLEQSQPRRHVILQGTEWELMKIFVYAMSGLGNQMFQYAAGLYFSSQYNTSLTIVKSPIEEVSHGSPRPFLLDQFALSAPIQTASPLERLLCSRNSRYAPVSRMAGRLLGARRFSEPTQHHFTSELSFPHHPSNIYLRDYWQAAAYATAVAPALRKDLRFRHPPNSSDNSVLEKISAAPISISVHVRRGDYVTGNSSLALPLSYYQKAWHAVAEGYPNAEFFIFSDDIEFARENLPKIGKRHFVSHNDERTAFNDLRMMSSCDHHIIANSSFSWWGAWLNPNPTKLVVAPLYWRNTVSSQCDELFPPGWLTINNLSDRS